MVQSHDAKLRLIWILWKSDLCQCLFMFQKLSDSCYRTLCNATDCKILFFILNLKKIFTKTNYLIHFLQNTLLHYKDDTPRSIISWLPRSHFIKDIRTKLKLNIRLQKAAYNQFTNNYWCRKEKPCFAVDVELTNSKILENQNTESMLVGVG